MANTDTSANSKAYEKKWFKTKRRLDCIFKMRSEVRQVGLQLSPTFDMEIDMVINPETHLRVTEYNKEKEIIIFEILNLEFKTGMHGRISFYTPFLSFEESTMPRK